MHDGASIYCSHAVRDVLRNFYHDRRIGRGGPTAQPPRSSDMDHLDFYLWRHLKALVCSAPVDNEEELTIALWTPVRLLATTPESLNGSGGPWWDASRRALNVMEDILSTYYRCAFSAITQKLYASGHMLVWTFFSLTFLSGLEQTHEF
jgi:hypothetical protein